MKNRIFATLSVVSLKLPPKSIIKKITLVAALMTAGLIFSFAKVSHGEVKFSKPVVMLKGAVHAEQTGKAQSVKVSIRSAENKDLEITSSVSNSETGSYLVVLAPNTKYIVRLEGAGVVAKDEEVQTPKINDTTVQISKDFTVQTTSTRKYIGYFVK